VIVCLYFSGDLNIPATPARDVASHSLGERMQLSCHILFIANNVETCTHILAEFIVELVTRLVAIRWRGVEGAIW
jgi:hypothetical protein